MMKFIPGIGLKEFVLKPIIMSDMAITVRKVLDDCNQ